MRCSFCGKSSGEVKKLLAGPRRASGRRLHICDACVGVCNRILGVLPDEASGWDSLATPDLLAGLKPAEASVQGMRDVLQQQVEILRKRGISWAEIGAAMGMSRQAAWERFS